ncbi:DNA repair helicase, putative [Perkinsus marinus ATCC 50983]|uniref:DNA repair helicase, putative n=1 Tax=Perkinsus marinus (strain ATCC 50983 / TXsc) TaxID=423536 RepID=C5K4W8_PERM5|nr:DNA repair helicase, putative [Perkinsus marinus ATCC 50983]EER20390.1 DNA repair helicase, putative [Perkinsus marinus ATCC 50983]|eukprot:XP_002788594.1 DNA repair helicase, putative [Perkinsus marinus ATCC 50983]
MCRYNLHATFRWAVSGTPFQNRVGDLYALVRFLKLDPFSHYFCSQCDCKALNFGPFDARTRCIRCHHSRRSHWSYFRRYITRPITMNASSAEGRQSLQLLRKIFGNILLRRTKAEREQDVHLPPLVMETRYVRLEPSEQAFYDRLAQEYQDKVEQLAEEGMLEAKVSELLVLLMRLRQACNSGLLIKYSENKQGHRECELLRGIDSR